MRNKHGVPRSRIDFLKSVPILEGLPDKALAKLDSHLDEVAVQPGHQITTAGQNAYETFIVADGTAEVRVDGEVVGETTVGDMVGEIGVLQHTKRTATVTATTPMRLLVVSSREVDWLLNDPTLAERVRDNLQRHLQGPQPKG